MKGKKFILIIGIILCLTGCVNVNNLNIETILSNFETSLKEPNTYRKGYEFYLPRGIGILKAGANYAILTSSNLKYYLYVDLISYKGKNDLTYEENPQAYYSKTFTYRNHKGFVEINLQQNNQYLVEIMYNYAKIEVMVNKNLLNNSLINSIDILNSIKYNDIIIEKLLEDDNLGYTEEVFDIFKDVVNESDTLDFIEEGSNVNNQDDEIKDTDYIN